jgi:hypothetical protein
MFQKEVYHSIPNVAIINEQIIEKSLTRRDLKGSGPGLNIWNRSLVISACRFT